MYSRSGARVAGDAGSTYLDLLLRGKALLEDIDDFVAAWHDALKGSPVAALELYEYLGMTWDEYQLWVEHPESLRFIVAAHKAKQPVSAVIEANERASVAAQASDQAEARRLMDWLIERGRA